MNILDTKEQALYLDWVNNFLSVACFAEYYGMSEEAALKLIEKQRSINHAYFEVSQ